MSIDNGLFDEERDLSAEVARLKRELAEAKAALAAKPIVDRGQLLALADAIPVLVSVIGRDHRYEFANKAYESWFGAQDGRVTGRNALEVLGQEAFDRLRPHFDRAIAGERVSFEAEIPYRSGGPRHVHATFAPRRAPNGEVTGVVAVVVDLSRRFVDETALRESEDHYRHAVELNPQTSWTSAPDGQLDHVSSRWMAWTGTTGLGSTYLEGLHADDRVRTLEVWGNSVATGEPYDIEHRVKMRDGSYRWMHSRAFPRRDAAGRIIKWYGTTEDIHDRKLAESALAAEAAERNAILSQLAEGVIVTDVDGRITFVNEAAARIHGMAQLHVGGADYAETYRLFTESGDPYPSNELPLARAVRGETVTEARWLIRRPDTEVLAVGSARPVLDAGGRQIGAVLTLRDESARETAEAMLRESESRFRAMADDTPLMIWTTAPSGYCTYLNRAWYDFTGQTREEAEGFGWLDVTHPDDRARADDAFRSANAARAEFRVEYRLRRGDGTYAWAIDAASPRFDRDGKFLGYVGSVVDIDEVKRSQQALAVSEQRFRAAVDAVEGVVWTNDAEGRMLGEQPGWAALTGQTEAEYSGFGWATAVHPADAQPTIDAWNDAVRERRTFVFEHRVRCADGEWRHFSIRAIPVIDRDGSIAEWVGVHTDITDQRAAEAAISESEARFRLIADSAPVPMWVTRLDRKREFVNRAYVDFLGISYEEAVDFDWRKVIHPDDLDRMLAEQVAKEGSLKPFTLEGRYRKANGEWCWLRSESQPRWGPNGEHVGFIGVAYDITIAKEAELALTAEVAERTAERDRMWRLSQDILLIVTPDGMVRAINPAVERYGYVPDDLIGQHFVPFVHPDDLAVTAEAVTRAASGPVVGFETRLRAADGTWNWISWTATPGDGVIFAFGRDVTAEKLRQAELEAAQEALRQSQKMEAVGQLTGGVAHDFNNLLTPIMGSLDMLRRRLPRDDHRAQRTVDTALQATERAATLVQRLLAFARRQDLQPRAVDVAELLGGMDDLLARSLGGGIRVTIDAPASVPPASVDPNQLELAILNLSINARDAMPAGGTLTISAAEACVSAPEADLAVGRYVRVAVTDTGVGMDADTVRRAIEPFFSTKGVGKGTGLGLSMVYGFAAQLGGALRLSSVPGAGTTAELWLPVSDESATAGGPERRVARPALRTANILLVDDEDLVRMGAADMLTDLGYNVVEARSGEEALELLRGREADFDLLITDYLMPDMTGSDLAEAVRREQPKLPMLLITGYTNLAEGVAADLPRLAKPFRQDDLAAQVAALIKNQIAG